MFQVNWELRDNNNFINVEIKEKRVVIITIVKRRKRRTAETSAKRSH